jgi:SNF2 family DNA or RNA helicase
MMVLDESTAIAEPTAQRTKKCLALGKLARYRRVMSGTPVAEGPFKIYTQMKFLRDDYWKQYGLANYFGFKNYFALFEKIRMRNGASFPKLIQYQNIDRLQEMIGEHSSRVLKEDALDLPPKLYSRIEFDLESKQRALYDQVKKQITVEIDENHVSETTLALVRLTRLQQITCGYAIGEQRTTPCPGDVVVWRGPEYTVHGEIIDVVQRSEHSDVKDVIIAGHQVTADGLGTDVEVVVESTDPRLVRMVAPQQHTIQLFADSDNPRLRCLKTVLEPITHKVIIWARFTNDIDIICQELGDACVRYDGRIKHDDREAALRRFREDDTVRYFVANPAALSMGVTLTQAKTVVYYSNNFALEKRLQSEDRAHRIGQDTSVNIIDIVAKNTVDGHITDTLIRKFQLAAQITGDRLREWLN